MTSGQGDGGSMPSGRQVLAAELRRLKEKSGLSFGRLADRTHYSRSSWERFLNGKQLPTAVALEEFATVMDADAEFLRGLLMAAQEPEDAPGARGEFGLLAGTGVGSGTGLHDGPGIAVGTGLPLGAGIAAGTGPSIGSGIAADAGAGIPTGAAGGAGTGLVPVAGIGSGAGAGAGLPAIAQGGTGAGTGGFSTGMAEGSGGAAADTGELGEPVVPAAAEPPVGTGTGATPPSAEPPGTVPPLPPGPGPARDWRNALRMTGLVTAGALVGSLATVLALGAGTGPSDGASGDDSASGTAAPSPRPGCSHDTCLRRDPQAMDCQWDATTARETWLRGMHIELRYSAACGAVWGRIESGAIGDSVTIKDKYDLELSATVRVDRDTYTGMLAVAADAPPRTVTVCGTIPKYHARECSPEDLVQP
ncbi:helix-turn-helix domain-containing protein [Streptomyces aureus]|uniref:helix-turn-helix domain-containing protein n=1 Tax=Streptomyces aureus TaxID=193461 RepID=UPI0036CF5069